ncbi:hypothetical protein CFP66_31860 [Pseudonocardia sp. MH-G8]|nr:hypothetical protein CFP66_31860 [Pseudonocardia sp. MH-G8]
MMSGITEQESAPEAEAAPPALAASRVRELGAAAVVLAAGIGVLLARSTIVAAHESELGPQWWPTVLGVALIVGAVALATLGLTRPSAPEEEPASGHGVAQLIAVLALIVGYGAAWYQLHFLVVTVPLIAGLVFVTGGRGIRALLVFPLLTTGLLYVIFGLLLQVPL